MVAAAAAFNYRDKITGQKIPTERAVYAAWFDDKTHEKLYDIFVSLITWDGYKPQLVASLGEPTILLDSDRVYAERRIAQKTALKKSAQKRALIKPELPEDDYTVILKKKERDNITLFRQI